MLLPPLTQQQRAYIAVQEMKNQPLQVVGQAFFLQLFGAMSGAIDQNPQVHIDMPIETPTGNYMARGQVKFIKQ